ncbi:MAG: hypothetical protein ACXVRZ_14175 [Gaiellaceae bacterium]
MRRIVESRQTLTEPSRLPLSTSSSKSAEWSPGRRQFLFEAPQERTKHKQLEVPAERLCIDGSFQGA